MFKTLNNDVFRHINSYLLINRCEYCKKEIYTIKYNFPTTCSNKCTLLFWLFNFENLINLLIVSFFILPMFI
jgi:hypothetical protein